MKRNTAVGSRGAEPSVTPVPVSRWSRTASGFTGICVLAVAVMAVIPFVIGGPAEQRHGGVEIALGDRHIAHQRLADRPAPDQHLEHVLGDPARGQPLGHQQRAQRGDA